MNLAPPLPAEDLRQIEISLNLHHSKWDTRLAGACMLSPQAVIMSAAEWNHLAHTAEQLARETMALEAELIERPDLFPQLGIPKPLRGCLVPCLQSPVRVMRFDFHPTRDGWAVSEVNSDVPGGYGESTFLPRLYQPFHEGLCLPPSPLDAWGEAMHAAAPGGRILFLSAPGFLEDHQVVSVLMRHLTERGCACRWVQSPAAIDWRAAAFDAIVRFYQAEWIAALPRRTNRQRLLSYRGIMMNPAISVLSESKRFPLTWASLAASSSAWRAWMPESRDPRDIAASERGDWVLKAAYSNTGDAVILGDQKAALRKAQRDSGRWVAQRRFETIKLDSADGPLHPCVGVFVINGRAAGAYIRLSRTQVTNCFALEAPLFLQ